MSEEISAIESLEREEEQINAELSQAFLENEPVGGMDVEETQSQTQQQDTHAPEDQSIAVDYLTNGVIDQQHDVTMSDAPPPVPVSAPGEVPAPAPDPRPESDTTVPLPDVPNVIVQPDPVPPVTSPSSVVAPPSVSVTPQPVPSIKLENGIDSATASKTGTPPYLRTDTPSSQRGSVTPALVNIKEEPQPAKVVPAPAPAPAAAPAPRSNPPSRLEQLRARIEADPFDAEAHMALIATAESSGDTEAIKQAYEGLLGPFAGAWTPQISYLKHFLNNASDFPYAESLFARFLRSSPSVELWKFYLTYIRRVNTSPTTSDTVKKAYEFALNYIGHDKDSGEIWKDYLTYLKEQPTHSTWEEQQKHDNLRRIYQRCVVIPLDNVEQLWREFDAFENSINKVTAKKFLQMHSPAYMTARTSLKTLRQMIDPLTRTPPPQGLPIRPTWADADKKLVMDWKQYLMWEESNPLDIEDPAVLTSRIQAAYRKAIAWMRFFPEIWYMAYHYTFTQKKVDDAAALLKQGMDANRSSFLLHFCFAELEETRKNYQSARTTFNNLITNLSAQVEKLKTAIDEEVEAAKGPPVEATTSEDSVTDDYRKANEEREERGRKVSERREKELEDLKAALGVVWIMLMRFERRSEGVKAFRDAFQEARKNKWTVWQVWEAAALMEYHCTKAQSVSVRIFELALKKFGDNAEFVLRYLGFLISVNDDSNARALFERVIPSFSADKAKPLWERWARYEYNFGDFAAAQKLEARIAEAYPSDPPIKRFAQRYQYLNLDTIATRDLGFGLRKPAAPRVSLPPPTAPPPATNDVVRRGASPSPPGRNNKRGRDTSRDRGGPPKRHKPSPPPMLRERERDRGWERDRIGSPRRRDTPPPRVLEEDKISVPSGAVPPPVATFLGKLPSASVFDGPVFRTDDLMQVFRSAIIPSAPSTLPPPPPRGRSPPPIRGRPPPDYGPYRGPGSSGRRY